MLSSIENILNRSYSDKKHIVLLEEYNPDSFLKTISAFANDIDNSGSGYIILGIKEEYGKFVEPVKDFQINELDEIRKDILRCCNFLEPEYFPENQNS